MKYTLLIVLFMFIPSLALNYGMVISDTNTISAVADSVKFALEANGDNVELIGMNTQELESSTVDDFKSYDVLLIHEVSVTIDSVESWLSQGLSLLLMHNAITEYPVHFFDANQEEQILEVGTGQVSTINYIRSNFYLLDVPSGVYGDFVLPQNFTFSQHAYYHTDTLDSWTPLSLIYYHKYLIDSLSTYISTQHKILDTARALLFSYPTFDYFDSFSIVDNISRWFDKNHNDNHIVDANTIALMNNPYFLFDSLQNYGFEKVLQVDDSDREYYDLSQAKLVITSDDILKLEDELELFNSGTPILRFTEADSGDLSGFGFQVGGDSFSRNYDCGSLNNIFPDPTQVSISDSSHSIVRHFEGGNFEAEGHFESFEGWDTPFKIEGCEGFEPLYVKDSAGSRMAVLRDIDLGGSSVEPNFPLWAYTVEWLINSNDVSILSKSPLLENDFDSAFIKLQDEAILTAHFGPQGQFRYEEGNVYLDDSLEYDIYGKEGTHSDIRAYPLVTQGLDGSQNFKMTRFVYMNRNETPYIIAPLKDTIFISQGLKGQGDWEVNVRDPEFDSLTLIAEFENFEMFPDITYEGNYWLSLGSLHFNFPESTPLGSSKVKLTVSDGELSSTHEMELIVLNEEDVGIIPLSQFIESTTNFKVYNLNGKLVKELHQVSSQEQLDVYMQSVSPGSYVLKSSNGTSSVYLVE
jgi:hypothetical protein